jgi:hypothetical protein
MARTEPRIDAAKRRIPPIAMVDAPIAIGLTLAGKKLAAVPVVPHMTDAATRASTPLGDRRETVAAVAVMSTPELNLAVTVPG